MKGKRSRHTVGVESEVAPCASCFQFSVLPALRSTQGKQSLSPPKTISGAPSPLLRLPNNFFAPSQAE